jgi:hypothetical protein
VAALQVDIGGTDLPGRRFCPNPQGEWLEDGHVFLGLRSEPKDLVPGDAPGATRRTELTVKSNGDAGFDFRGPPVQGKRGERFLAPYWGTIADGGTFQLFRGAKLRLADSEPALLHAASSPGKRLVGRLGLTDARGGPRCASVRPPDIIWSADNSS